jgi:elongation factor Ts
MSEIDAKVVMDLRKTTGAGMMECKKALAEACGDVEKATDILRKAGLKVAAKKSGRTTSEGLIEAYIHPGSRIGVLLEVNCETDFVARNEVFRELTHNLAMHVAWANPRYLTREEVPADVIERERDIYATQARNSGKPEAVIAKIVDGKLDKFYQEVCLLEQPFIKDDAKSIKDILNEKISVTGENIVVRRFQRFQLGEGA